jgi:hypothetical protein
MNIFSHKYFAKILLIINIVGTPLMVLIFNDFFANLIPNSIYESKFWFMEDPLRVAYVSGIISLITFFVLLFEKANYKKILMYVFFPFILSIIISPISTAIATGILILFMCTFQTCHL